MRSVIIISSQDFPTADLHVEGCIIFTRHRGINITFKLLKHLTDVESYLKIQELWNLLENLPIS